METQTIEYKSRWKDEYLHYISGFANASGGTLYVGYTDNGTLVGIEDAKELLEKLPNKAVQSTGLVPEINIHTKEGKDFLTITVKPSAQPISCNGKYYLRSGSTLQELNGSALQDFILHKMGKEWDDLVCEGATLDEIDRDAIDYFLRKAIPTGRMSSEALNDNTKTILYNLNLTTPEGKLKNAAILLFGKDPQRHFISARFRIGYFAMDATDLRYQDEIAGNILQMADKVMWALRSRYLKAYVRYEGMHRVEDLEIPEEALRELVYNAIVHRDYLGADTQMKVYDNRIWLWNDGGLPQGFDEAIKAHEHISKPRNRLIAGVFYRAGFIESWGQGIGKVCSAFREKQLPEPTFEDFMGGTLVQIQRNNADKVNDKVNDTENDQIKNIQLTGIQQKVYDLIKGYDQINDQIKQKDDQINTPFIAQQLQLSYSTVKRALNVLLQHKLIKHEGSRKTGYWAVKQGNNEK